MSRQGFDRLDAQQHGAGVLYVLGTVVLLVTYVRLNY